MTIRTYHRIEDKEICAETEVVCIHEAYSKNDIVYAYIEARSECGRYYKQIVQVTPTPAH